MYQQSQDKGNRSSWLINGQVDFFSTASEGICGVHLIGKEKEAKSSTFSGHLYISQDSKDKNNFLFCFEDDCWF